MLKNLIARIGSKRTALKSAQRDRKKLNTIRRFVEKELRIAHRKIRRGEIPIHELKVYVWISPLMFGNTFPEPYAQELIKRGFKIDKVLTATSPIPRDKYRITKA